MKCCRISSSFKMHKLNRRCWPPVSPCFSDLFPNCLTASDEKPLCHLAGNNFPNDLNLSGKENEILTQQSALLSLHDGHSTVQLHFFLLTSSSCLFSFLLLSSHPSRHLPAPLCPVAAAEGCTLSGLTQCPLKGSGLLVAAPGDTTHSPEPCSGMAGSPSRDYNHPESDLCTSVLLLNIYCTYVWLKRFTNDFLKMFFLLPFDMSLVSLDPSSEMSKTRT